MKGMHTEPADFAATLADGRTPLYGDNPAERRCSLCRRLAPRGVELEHEMRRPHWICQDCGRRIVNLVLLKDRPAGVMMSYLREDDDLDEIPDRPADYEIWISKREATKTFQVKWDD